jgi:hypothetical protein
LVIVPVAITIKLDNETRPQTHKVADVLTDRVLTPKLEAVQLPTPKGPPHALLGRIGISSQISRAFCVDRISSHSADDRPRTSNWERDLHGYSGLSPSP